MSAARDSQEGQLFASTQWSLILRAQERSETALGALYLNYRQPLMIWLRSRGASPQDAEDTVQGLLEKMLDQDFLRRVGPEKGKFRTYLLQCLKNHVRDQHDKQNAAKRGGGRAPESLDEVTEGGHFLHEPATPEAGPDREYDRAWASAIQASAFARLKDAYARKGRAELYSELLSAISGDQTALSYREIGSRHGMTEEAVKNEAYRMRKTLSELIREEVSQTLDAGEDVEAEIRYLIELARR